MHYIAFVHKNAKENTTREQWDAFFARAREAGVFRGGSAFGVNFIVGDQDVPYLTDDLSGYMLFEHDDFETLRALLHTHPVITNGGSISLCEIVKTIEP